MHPKTTPALLALALASLTSAQYLTNQQYGSLPDCASNCPAVTTPQQQCGSNDWACFCSGVWSQIQAAPTQICAQTCPSAADVQAAYQWYQANCGSDNGASEHSGTGSGGSSGNSGNDGPNNGGAGGSGTQSASPGSSSGTSSSGSGSSTNSSANQSWFDGHWRWVVMIIVLFFGLLGLAFLGLWLKKRHYRKRDQISGGFNPGITERTPGNAPPMSESNAAFSHPNESSTAVGDVPGVSAMGGRDSPARTRDAFMPYGYGYTRSDSRLGSMRGNEQERATSPLARGTTPVGAVERGDGGEEIAREPTPSGKKGRRVLVRERSGADSVGDGRF